MTILLVLADSMDPLPRSDIAAYAPNPRALDALERQQDNAGAVIVKINELVNLVNALAGEPFLTFSAPTDDALENGKVANGSANVTIALADGTATFDLSNTGVIPKAYGDATKLASFTVDAKGRIKTAVENTLESGNVAETTKLFFTGTRALAAVSVAAPATATSPGVKGQIASAPGFFYHCVAASTWERVATAAF